MPNGVVEVSVVLPAYNEEATIETTVDRTLASLGEFLPADAFEVIVAEDGCEDRTPEIADRLADEDPRVRHVHSDDRLGRGGALTFAFRQARGSTLVYMDSDLATDLDHLEELVESIRSGSYHVATGSRWIKGREADRPVKRSVASRGYNTLVRGVLGSDLQDHQCGFKAFDRAALEYLLTDVEDDHWFWDTEILVRAQREGLRVREFPVDWTPKGDTKVNLVRDGLEMGTSILTTRWSLADQAKAKRRAHTIGTAALLVAAIGLMATYLDPGQVLAEVTAADPAWLGFAAAIYVFSWPLRGQRYQRILEGLSHRCGLHFLTASIFVSQTGNLVFPARSGDGLRAYFVNSRGDVPLSSGFASLTVERIFDLLAITGLGLSGLVWLGVTGRLEVGTLIGGSQAWTSTQLGLLVAVGVAVGTVLAVAAILAVARSRRDPFARLAGRLPGVGPLAPLKAGVERFGRDLQAIVSKPGTLENLFASSLGIWLLDVATAVAVLSAFGVPTLAVPYLVVTVLAVSLGNLAKVLPLSPGGIGLYEGVFTGLFVLWTPLGATVALSVALVDHTVKNAVTVLGGLVALVGWNTSLVEVARRAPEAE